eukprot:1607594-Pleurochrysis_carterae.AAC.2
MGECRDAAAPVLCHTLIVSGHVDVAQGVLKWHESRPLSSVRPAHHGGRCRSLLTTRRPWNLTSTQPRMLDVITRRSSVL